MTELKYVIVNGKKLAIYKFELEMMASHPAIILIAKRRSGKSWVCRDILRHYKSKIPVGIIISKSEKLQEPFYSEFFPDSFIYYKFESRILEKLLSRQEKLIEKYNNKKKHGEIINTNALI